MTLSIPHLTDRLQRLGGFQGQLVILQVIAPAQDGISIAGAVPQRGQGAAPALLQRLLALGGQRFQVTLLPQLLPDLQKLAFGGGPAQRMPALLRTAKNILRAS